MKYSIMIILSLLLLSSLGNAQRNRVRINRLSSSRAQAGNNNSLSSKELGIRYLKLGNTYREGKNFVFAKEFLDKGFDMIKRSRDKYWIGVAHEFYGYYYRDMGDFNQADYQLNLAKDIYDTYIKMENGSDDAIRDAISALYSDKAQAGEDTTAQSNANQEMLERMRELQEQNDLLNQRLDDLGRGPVAAEPDTVYIKTEEETDFASKGSFVFTASAGYSETYLTKDESSVFPPIALELAYKNERFEMAAFGALSSAKGMITDGTIPQFFEYKHYIAGLKANFLLYMKDNHDLGVSVFGAYDIADVPKGFSVIEEDEPFIFGATGFFRHYFNKSFGIKVEAGYGISIISAGFVFKI